MPTHYSLNTKRNYRSLAKRLSKAYDLMPETDERRMTLLRQITQLKDKIGLDWTDKEFQDFWDAEPGRPKENLDAQEIINEFTKEDTDERAMRKKQELLDRNPDLAEKERQRSEATLKELMERYPVKPEQETNRGHEEQGTNATSTIVTYWAEWAD